MDIKYEHKKVDIYMDIKYEHKKVDKFMDIKYEHKIWAFFNQEKIYIIKI